MNKAFRAIMLAAFLILLCAATARADGPAACTFWGTVQLNGANAPGGTLITAIIKGDEYRTEILSGDNPTRYFITICPLQGQIYRYGDEVTFKVDGQDTGQSGMFMAGTMQRLDLTASMASGPTVNGSRVNLWPVIPISLGILAVGAAVYLLTTRQRRAWVTARSVLARTRRTVGQMPGAIASEQSPVASSRVPPASASVREITSIAKISVASKLATRDGSIGVHPRMDKPISLKAIAKRSSLWRDGQAIDEGSEGQPERPMLYQSIVELIVLSQPMVMGQLYKFASHLKQLKRAHRAKVLDIRILPGQGLRIRLVLYDPIPLLQMLQELPEVDAVANNLKRIREMYPAFEDEKTPATSLIAVRLKA